MRAYDLIAQLKLLNLATFSTLSCIASYPLRLQAALAELDGLLLLLAVLNSLFIRPSLWPGLPHGPVLHGLGDLTLTMLPRASSRATSAEGLWYT